MDLATRSAWGDTAMNKLDVKLIAWRTDSSLRLPLMGLMSIAMGTLPLLRGKTHCENYWGSPVFAPFAILIGLLFLVGVFTHSRKGISFSREKK
jgi:hypothetical protein